MSDNKQYWYWILLKSMVVVMIVIITLIGLFVHHEQNCTSNKYAVEQYNRNERCNNLCLYGYTNDSDCICWNENGSRGGHSMMGWTEADWCYAK